MKTYRAYLRASTKEQDATRAKEPIQQFAESHGIVIAKFYTENASGASLQRPKLNELLDDCNQGDIIIIESIDRLTRLKDKDWQKLKNRISEKGVRIVALDLPTTHEAITKSGKEDDLTDSILRAINTMMIDVMATMARKDYEMRRERQAQGIARAKAENPEKYSGSKKDLERYQIIRSLRKAGLTYRAISKQLGCSFGTIREAMMATD